MAGARFVVRGLVQGVGFRWFVTRNARQLGLVGWVSNCSDGSVEVIAAGEQAALMGLERELRRGPPGARVTDVEKSSNPHQMAGVNHFAIG